MGVVHQYSPEAVMVCHSVVALKVCMGVVYQYSPDAVMVCHVVVAL